MIMQATAKGLLRHRFWGTYSAAIGLEFKDEVMAKAALRVLGAADWKVGDKVKKCLVWVGEDTDQVTEVLVSFGADANKIHSIAKSIDHGEFFTVSIPVDVVDPNQLILFDDTHSHTVTHPRISGCEECETLLVCSHHGT
jgi:hypothetical protein